MMAYCLLGHLEQISVNSETKFLFDKMYLKNILCKMVAILFGPRCINHKTSLKVAVGILINMRGTFKNLDHS